MAEDMWSMDQYFIDNLNSLIHEYIEASKESDLDRMLKALNYIEILSSPKTDNDSVEHNLKWINENIDRVILYDEQGKPVGHNPKNRRIMMKRLDETFRLTLMKLEDKGIYTKKIKDPRHAMAEMGSE